MTIESYFTRDENETPVQRNWRNIQEREQMREFAQERITESKNKIPELGKINLDDVIHMGELYSMVVELGSNYTPLSDTFSELEGSAVGQLNTNFPVGFRSEHLPETRSTLIYCITNNRLERHGFNSVWHNKYNLKTINRNPLVEQVGLVMGSSLMAGAVFSVMGIGNWHLMPYLATFGGLASAGQFILPHTKEYRDEMRHDRLAWKIYKERKQNSE